MTLVLSREDGMSIISRRADAGRLSPWTGNRTLTRVERGNMKKALNRLLDSSLKVDDQWH